jgi:peptide/nickel transport system substrate-binding protein
MEGSYVNRNGGTTALMLNTRRAPFTDVRVRQAINYAVDRRKIAALLGNDSTPACQILPVGYPGYRRYCPYTVDPNPAGTWNAPNLAEAERLIVASHTRGTPITIWNLSEQNLAPVDRYLVSLLDRLGYPTRIKDFSSSDPTGPPRAADSRTAPQAALYGLPFGSLFPSASEALQTDFACRSFVPDSIANPNWSEFCDHRLDAQMAQALAAESSNAPDTAALWSQADRTATNQAPAVPLTTGTDIHLVSARVGNYQYSFAQGVLLDQLWVR